MSRKNTQNLIFLRTLFDFKLVLTHWKWRTVQIWFRLTTLAFFWPPGLLGNSRSDSQDSSGIIKWVFLANHQIYFRRNLAEKRQTMGSITDCSFFTATVRRNALSKINWNMHRLNTSGSYLLQYLNKNKKNSEKGWQKINNSLAYVTIYRYL